MALQTLRSGGKFYMCWLAGTWKRRFNEVRDNQIMDIQIVYLCEDIRKTLFPANSSSSRSRRYSLRLSSIMTLGLIKIYNRQAEILFKRVICLSNEIVCSRLSFRPQHRRNSPRRRVVPALPAVPAMPEDEILLPMTANEIETFARRVTMVDEPLVFANPLENQLGDFGEPMNQSVARDNPIIPAILVTSPEHDKQIQNDVTVMNELSELIPAMSESVLAMPESVLAIPEASAASTRKRKRTSRVRPVSQQLALISMELEPVVEFEERPAKKKKTCLIIDKEIVLHTSFMKNRMQTNIACKTAYEDQNKLLSDVLHPEAGVLFNRTAASRRLIPLNMTNRSFMHYINFSTHTKKLEDIITRNFINKPLSFNARNDATRDEQRARPSVLETLNISPQVNITVAPDMGTILLDANTEMQNVVLQSPLGKTINMDSVEIPIDKTIPLELTSLAQKDITEESHLNIVTEMPNNNTDVIQEETNLAMENIEKRNEEMEKYLSECWSPDALLKKIIIEKVNGVDDVTLVTLIEKNYNATCNVPKKRVYCRAFYSLLRLKQGCYVEVEKLGETCYIKNINLADRVIKSLKDELM